MNKDIKDKVYINGKWVDDYFLTTEKNEELKNLREDLTTETEEREALSTLHKNDVNSILKTIDTKTSDISKELTDEKTAREADVETLTTKIDTELETRQSQVDTLEASINTEKERAIAAEETLSSSISQLDTDLNELDTTLQNDYYKQDVVDSKIETAKDEVKQDILGGDLDSAFDTLKEVYDYLEEHASEATDLFNSISTDITDLKNKDTEQDSSIANIESNISDLENNFDNYYTKTEVDTKNNSQDTKIETLESTVDGLKAQAGDTSAIENLTNQLVNKVDKAYKTGSETIYKVLSDNNFSDDDKAKLDSLENIDTSNFEILDNKVETITDEANNTTYPTTKAVKDYVQNLSQTEIDDSNYVKISGESQTVEATTAFKDLQLMEDSLDNPTTVSLSVEDYNSHALVSLLKSDNLDNLEYSYVKCEPIIASNNLNWTKTNGDVETYYFDSTADINSINNLDAYTILNKEQIVNLINSKSTSTTGGSSDIKYFDGICKTESDLSVYKDYYKNTYDSLEHDDNNDSTFEDWFNNYSALVLQPNDVSTPRIFTYSKDTDSFIINEESSITTIFYTAVYIDSNLYNNLYLFCLDTNSVGYSQIYPLEIPSENLNVDIYKATTSGTNYLVDKDSTKSFSYNLTAEQTLAIKPLVVKHLTGDNTYTYVSYNGTDTIEVDAPSIDIFNTKLDTKVDKVDGKTLTTNDLTTTLKSSYDDAVTKAHTHTNKTILDNITASYTTAEQTKLSNLNSDLYEKIANKETSITSTANDTKYPTSLAVKTYVESKVAEVNSATKKYLHKIKLSVVNADRNKTAYVTINYYNTQSTAYTDIIFADGTYDCTGYYINVSDSTDKKAAYELTISGSTAIVNGSDCEIEVDTTASSITDTIEGYILS